MSQKYVATPVETTVLLTLVTEVSFFWEHLFSSLQPQKQEIGEWVTESEVVRGPQVERRVRQVPVDGKHYVRPAPVEQYDKAKG